MVGLQGIRPRDALARQLRPKTDVFTKERLERWFSVAADV